MAGHELGEVGRAAAIIPVKFEYAAPTTLDEAVRLLAGNASALVLAGGQSLIPAMTVRRVAPALVVDVRQIDGLRGIANLEVGAGLRIGAATSLAEIAANEAIRDRYTALAEAAEAAGDAQVRNRGTIGGSLADGHPAGDLIAAAIVLDATVNLVGPKGTRKVAAADLVTGPYATDLKPGEIITAVELPAPAHGSGSSYVKQRHPGSGYAICGVAAALTVGKGGEVGAVRVAVTGAAEHPRRLDGAEDAATGKSLAEASAAAEAAVAHSRLKFVADLAASAEYRKHLAGVLAGRAIILAGQRGGGA